MFFVLTASRNILLVCCQDDALLAYQVCFDLFANEMQSFLLKVRPATLRRLSTFWHFRLFRATVLFGMGYSNERRDSPQIQELELLMH